MNEWKQELTKLIQTLEKKAYIQGGIDEILRHEQARKAVEAELESARPFSPNTEQEQS